MVPQVTRLISQGADNTVAMSFESLRQCYIDHLDGFNGDGNGDYDNDHAKGCVQIYVN